MLTTVAYKATIPPDFGDMVVVLKPGKFIVSKKEGRPVKKGIILAIGFVSLALFVAAPSFAQITIKVGFVDTYSGPASVYTFDVLDGFKMAIEKVNAKGGVLGKKIEYVTPRREV